MMENKEIEAWFEGVIIGVWRNEARADDDAMRPAVADMGSDLKTGLHCGWPLMLSQWVGQTTCFYISCDHDRFFSDQWDEAESPSPNVPLHGAQVLMARAKCLIFGNNNNNT